MEMKFTLRKLENALSSGLFERKIAHNIIKKSRAIVALE